MSRKEENDLIKGSLTAKDLDNVLPPKEHLKKGAVSVLECVERFPCNVCEKVCPVKAILKKSLVDPPVVNWNKCTGCGICLGRCPGLAIFMVDLSMTGENGVVTIPYEFLPLPKEGEEVIATDRKGKPLESGTVSEVSLLESNLALVSIVVSKQIAEDVRNIRRIKG